MRAAELLQQLLAIDTTNPPGNEHAVAEVLASVLAAGGFKTEILRSPQGRANLVARAEGASDRAALVLLSHSDVVGVERERWSHEPFGGEADDQWIWGRGALDMKGLAALHACAAIEAAHGSAREIVVVCVADEEAGGEQGARWLTSEHTAKVGFGDGRPHPEVLGEGAFGLTGILDRPLMPIVVGEKSAAWLRLRATGDPGHGALPPNNAAPRALARAVAALPTFAAPRVHEVMREQFVAMAGASSGAKARVFAALASARGSLAARALVPVLRRQSVALAALLSDTISPTELAAGYRRNVVPGEASASLDCRLLPDTDPDEFIGRLRARVGSGITVEAMARTGGPVSERTPLYRILEQVSHETWPDFVVTPTLCPGITDVRFFRTLGASGFGWAPFVLTPELLATVHGHDERVARRDVERGEQAMIEVVRRACA